MPIVFLKSHRDELIDEAVQLLLAPASADLPSGPISQEVRQEFEKICGDYLTNLEEAKASPRISEVRNVLKKSAAAAAALAKQFREDANKLKFGVATFRPEDSPEITQAKRDEIESFKTELQNAAEILDHMSGRLSARHDHWEGKNIAWVPNCRCGSRKTFPSNITPEPTPVPIVIVTAQR